MLAMEAELNGGSKELVGQPNTSQSVGLQNLSDSANKFDHYKNKSILLDGINFPPKSPLLFICAPDQENKSTIYAPPTIVALAQRLILRSTSDSTNFIQALLANRYVADKFLDELMLQPDFPDKLRELAEKNNIDLEALVDTCADESETPSSAPILEAGTFEEVEEPQPSTSYSQAPTSSQSTDSSRGSPSPRVLKSCLKKSSKYQSP